MGTNNHGRSDAPAIVTQNLTRKYTTTAGVFRRRSQTATALRGLNLRVESGHLHGILGPNGAGKTTAIRILTTLLLPTTGSARVLGMDVVTQARAIRRQIGVVFGGDRGVYDRLSGLDNLRYFAELHDLPRRRQAARITEVLETVDLRGAEGNRVEGYSRGMRQRLHIARCLLHDPKVIFLDEPSLGIDPAGARQLRQTIRTLLTVGKTVLLTTHYLAEAEALCDIVTIIARGQVVIEGTPARITGAGTDGSVVEIEAHGVPDGTVAEIRSLAGVRAVTVQDNGPVQLMSVQVESGSDLTQPILGRLTGVHVGRVSIREPTLEDAYLALVA